jgi:hypothetical protein
MNADPKMAPVWPGPVEAASHAHKPITVRAFSVGPLGFAVTGRASFITGDTTVSSPSATSNAVDQFVN